MKKVLIVVAALAVVVIGALVYLGANLDGLVKEAIQTYGSEATKTAVRVDSVNLELKNGKAQISGLTVANPAGFTDPNIFALGMISTKVDIASINKNPIIIDEIHIGAPTVVYEINKAGVSNIDVLKKNLGVGGSDKSEGSSGGDQVKMIIRKLVVEGTSAKVRIAALGKDQSVTLPRIVMTDIGKKSGGATAAEVATQLSGRMLSNIKDSVAKLGVDKYLGKSADAIKAQMSGVGGAGTTDKLGGALKGMLGN